MALLDEEKLIKFISRLGVGYIFSLRDLMEDEFHNFMKDKDSVTAVEMREFLDIWYDAMTKAGKNLYSDKEAKFISRQELDVLQWMNRLQHEVIHLPHVTEEDVNMITGVAKKVQSFIAHRSMTYRLPRFFKSSRLRKKAL
jgi:hypothetical protein